MQLCNLTDNELRELASRHRRLVDFLGAGDAIKATANAVCTAIDELIARRAGVNPRLVFLEKTIAYESACSLIESSCFQGKAEIGDPNEWFDLDTFDSEIGSIDDEVEYLELRGLLNHHPENPKWISFRDEGEEI
ncbi:hypothetical protein FTO74_14245 [Granulicella sp. WH15]|uniref:hypothetical protein n=1 Tax=Granulicella sp. WH15 TaxID=2602070 RepID=UPI0013676747|nr:hypothetical protein [Granulicella sp. WH15]QHN04392.1 hypothetical protein FTO74_14245 [Granulicella sp. WH15]